MRTVTPQRTELKAHILTALHIASFSCLRDISSEMRSHVDTIVVETDTAMILAIMLFELSLK